VRNVQKHNKAPQAKRPPTPPKVENKPDVATSSTNPTGGVLLQSQTLPTNPAMMVQMPQPHVQMQPPVQNSMPWNFNPSWNAAWQPNGKGDWQSAGKGAWNNDGKGKGGNPPWQIDIGKGKGLAGKGTDKGGWKGGKGGKSNGKGKGKGKGDGGRGRGAGPVQNA
jgi:hypothetical protein